MAKRAPVEGLTGSRGQTAVKGMFEDLLWGPVPVTEHDTGTDFFVQVRDANRYELGLVLGVQVKSEKRYFKKLPAATAIADDSGWTYYADQDDVKLWLTHSVPHVIALFDKKTGLAFWSHITTENVKWTDKKAHIKVPASQQINEDSRDALLAVATTRLESSWEGSAWDDQQRVPYASRLRFALITPRIIAPHLNRPPETVSPEEAIAALCLCRMEALRRYESSGSMPNAESRRTGNWRWRLYDALLAYLTTGDLSTLRERTTDATRPDEVAAATALLVAILIEQGRPVEALGVPIAEPNDPVDAGWLEVQRARAQFETGDLSGCLGSSVRAAALRGTQPTDPTAQAIAASSLSLIFNASGWAAGDFEPMVRASDNAAAWWRAQQRAWGLSGMLEDAFQRWSAGAGTAKGPHQRDTWLRLRSAVFTAGAAGNHDGWRSSTIELARFALTTASGNESPDEIASYLRDLVLAGEDKSIKATTARLIEDGPHEAVAIAISETDLATSTRSSLEAAASLLAAGADVVPPHEADRHVGAVLQLLSSGETLAALTRSVSWIQRNLIEALRGLWLSASEDGRAAIRHHLASMSPVPDQLLAHEYAGLVDSIKTDAWAETDVGLVLERVASYAGTPDAATPQVEGEAPSELSPFGDHWELADSWQGLLSARGENATREALLEQAAGGSHRALLALRDLTLIPHETAARVITALAKGLDAARAAYANGHGATIGGLDEGSTLIKLNLLFPQHANWQPIYDLLSENSVPEQQEQSLQVLAGRGIQIPEAIRNRLLPIIQGLAEIPAPEPRFLIPPVDVGALAREAIQALDPTPLDPVHAAHLLAEGLTGRRELAVRLADAPANTDLTNLYCLAYDPDPRTSGSATRGIARALIANKSPDACLEVLTDLLAIPGVRRARAIASALRSQRDLGMAAKLAERLAEHPSASVRRMVRHGVEG